MYFDSVETYRFADNISFVLLVDNVFQLVFFLYSILENSKNISKLKVWDNFGVSVFDIF